MAAALQQPRRATARSLERDALFQSLVPGKVGEGVLDFTVDLSMRGRNAVEVARTAQGEASLHGENLKIAIGNLDEKLSHYESSQNFNHRNSQWQRRRIALP